MKKGYKECPFCKNEIKKEAIKCQYCKEMLPEEEPETKECPFCKNKIKYDAIKCQYCKEYLIEDKQLKSAKVEKTEEITKVRTAKRKEKIKNVEEIDDNEFPKTTMAKRFWAGFFDYVINATFIGWIYNVVIALWKGKTLGFDILGIKLVSEDGNELKFKQKFLRFILYRPIASLFLFFIAGVFSYFGIDIIVYTLMFMGFSIMIFNIIEWVFKSPTFYEKKLSIKKYQGGKVKIGWIIAIVIILIIWGKIYSGIQDIKIKKEHNKALKTAQSNYYDSIIDGDLDDMLDKANKRGDELKNSDSQYNEFYKELFGIVTDYQSSINSIGNLEVEDIYDYKDIQKLNEIKSNWEQLVNVDSKFYNSVDSSMEKLIKDYGLNPEDESISGKYGFREVMEKKKVLINAEKKRANMNIDFLKFLIGIQDDFIVDENGEIKFYEGGYKMDKYNEYIELLDKGYSEFMEVYNENLEYSKERAKYRKDKL